MDQQSPRRFNRISMLPVGVVLSARMLLLFNAIPLAQTGDGLITCEAGTFTYGEPASIDCNFRTDIAASELDLSVTKYPTDGLKGDTGKDVLLCPWDTEQKKHDCSIVMANYTFDNILTGHLMVRIPAVNFQHAGWYMCYFVPTEQFHPQACELLVQERPESTRTDERGESQDVLPIIMPCVIVVLVAVCIVGLVLFLRRRSAKRTRRLQNSAMELQRLAEPLRPEENQRGDNHLEDLQLSQDSLQQVMNAIQQEMQKGLDSSTQRSAGTGMFRTFVNYPLPTVSDSGFIMVFQLRSDHLTIQFVILQSPKVQCPFRDLTVPRDVDTARKLFDFITGSAKRFVKDNTQFVGKNTTRRRIPVAFDFAFPCKHETLREAYLTRWTKEFNCEGVQGNDLNGMLQQAFRNIRRLRSLEIVAIMNDTVSTLVSAACLDPKCKLALYVGNGLNACYVENFNSTGAEAEPQSEVVNTELGGLWNEADLDYLRTVYDRELDTYSADPGSQILEKMVSWMYIGEIVRLVLKRLKNDGALFQSVSGDCELFIRKDSFFPENVMIIEGDTTAPFDSTITILNGLGIELCTDEDITIVRDVCRLVCERSAFLTAAGLAALINHVNQPEVTVVVDGVLCRSYPRFRDMMYNKTLELVESGLTFSLVSPSCDSSIGAARIAAASLR